MDSFSSTLLPITAMVRSMPSLHRAQAIRSDKERFSKLRRSLQMKADEISLSGGQVYIATRRNGHYYVYSSEASTDWLFTEKLKVWLYHLYFQRCYKLIRTEVNVLYQKALQDDVDQSECGQSPRDTLPIPMSDQGGTIQCLRSSSLPLPRSNSNSKTARSSSCQKPFPQSQSIRGNDRTTPQNSMAGKMSSQSSVCQPPIINHRGRGPHKSLNDNGPALMPPVFRRWMNAGIRKSRAA